MHHYDFVVNAFPHPYSRQLPTRVLCIGIDDLEPPACLETRRMMISLSDVFQLRYRINQCLINSLYTEN